MARSTAATVILVPLLFCNFLVTGFHLVMPNHGRAGEDMISKVSSFYGPGSVSTWLLLVLSNSEFKSYYRLFWRLFRGQEMFHQEDSQNFKVDRTIIASAIYPCIAFVDLQLHCRGFIFTLCPDQDIDAQLAVAYLAWTVGVFAIQAHIAYDRKIPTFGDRSSRLVLWLGMLGITSIQLNVHDPPVKGYISDIQLSSRLAVYIVITGFLLEKANWVGRPLIGTMVLISVLDYPVTGGIMGKRFTPSASPGSPGSPAWRFSFPRSGAKWSDLDQAAAFGIAVATSPPAVSLMKAVKRRFAEVERQADHTAASRIQKYLY